MPSNTSAWIPPRDHVCDSADLVYIAKVKVTAEYHAKGKITNREMLEHLLLLHAEWCGI